MRTVNLLGLFGESKSHPVHPSDRSNFVVEDPDGSIAEAVSIVRTFLPGAYFSYNRGGDAVTPALELVAADGGGICCVTCYSFFVGKDEIEEIVSAIKQRAASLG